ncbi:hypothetical protein [Anaerotignum sp.]|uniref:hypothetical protein n=1 Tax=Anaerotignum sp. TaxID=2039241 RepID=UPI0037363416
MRKTGDFCQRAKMGQIEKNNVFGKEIMFGKNMVFLLHFSCLALCCLFDGIKAGHFLYERSEKNAFEISMSWLRNGFGI